MERYVLRYTGKGPTPLEDVERIRSRDDTEVLGYVDPSLYVQAPRDAIDEIAEAMPGWLIAPERTIRAPGKRKSIRPS